MKIIFLVFIIILMAFNGVYAQKVCPNPTCEAHRTNTEFPEHFNRCPLCGSRLELPGVKWECVTFNADWSPRSGHAAVVFNNKIWIIGGGENNDVWCWPR
jgi:hypothetical protein